MTPVIDAVKQLFMDLRTQKLRTFLTTFGIVWGTVSLSLLLAFGNGVADIAPLEGFLHPRSTLDTLGYDAPESGCKAR